MIWRKRGATAPDPKDVEDIDKITAQRLSKPSVLLLSFTVLTAGAAITVLLVAQGAIRVRGIHWVRHFYCLFFTVSRPCGWHTRDTVN